MGRWLRELKQNLGEEIIVHVVGTKSDVVAQDPSKRAVPFERCIAYVAENLYPSQTGAPPSTGSSGWGGSGGGVKSNTSGDGMASPQSNRSSGFWGQDAGWDCCHEVSAKDGEGVDEVFRVITRKLVDEQNKKLEEEARIASLGSTPGTNGAAGPNGYFDYPVHDGNGSFRVGYGDKRRSWLGFPTTPGIREATGAAEFEDDIQRLRSKRGGKCC
jgi:hypothetical protein